LDIGICCATGIAQSVRRIATFWTVRSSNLCESEVFHCRLDRPRGPPSLLYKVYCVIHRGKAAGGGGGENEHSPRSSTGLIIGLSCTSASGLCLHRRAISIFGLLQYIQYEMSVSLTVRRKISREECGLRAEPETYVSVTHISSSTLLLRKMHYTNTFVCVCVCVCVKSVGHDSKI
jgi:hypothetical protein